MVVAFPFAKAHSNRHCERSAAISIVCGRYADKDCFVTSFLAMTMRGVLCNGVLPLFWCRHCECLFFVLASEAKQSRTYADNRLLRPFVPRNDGWAVFVISFLAMTSCVTLFFVGDGSISISIMRTKLHIPRDFGDFSCPIEERSVKTL